MNDTTDRKNPSIILVNIGERVGTNPGVAAYVEK